MALVVADRVKETTTTTGTGTLTLAGAVNGFQAFSVLGDGSTTYYAIYDTASDDWEVGLGTYTLSGTTLARTTVLSSSNAGAAVNLSAGSKDVFVTYPAERAVVYGASGDTNVSIKDLSDVYSSMTPTDGQVLTYDTTNGWQAEAGGITYTAYTANATLTADQGAIADTSGGVFTLTLPASPSTGNQVIIVDGTESFGANNLTVGRNGSTIEGVAEDLVCDINGVSITFIYNGATWAIYVQIGAVSGTAVTETGTQTLTNKTLTNPTINNYTEGTVAIGTVTTSHTFDLTSGTLQTATLTASTACTFTMPTASSGRSFLLVLNQAATTGNGTATFTSVLWAGGSAPTVTAAAGSIDMFSFVSDGTNWYGAVTQDFQ